MKFSSISLFLLSACLARARFVQQRESSQSVINIALEEQRYLIELRGTETRWVTEAEKWLLRKEGQMFMDITDVRDLGTIRGPSTKKNKFPTEATFQTQVFPLFEKFNKSLIRSHLEYFTTFHNRFYKSEHGQKSSKWLLGLVNDTVKESGADKYGVYVRSFKHAWGQHSIIVTIPGKNNSTIVIGAHQDSINDEDPLNGRSPGADDDGTGTMTILEVLRVLLSSQNVREGKAENTIEFHWYAAEEAGMLGSQAIFSEYEKAGRDVKAMLQQDMTGFVQRTKDAGRKVEFGLMMNAADKEFMDYIKIIIEEYTDISWVETGCGRCYSDHQSALKAGYPAAFILEAAFELENNHAHSDDDLVKWLDFDHVVDHARLSLGLVYELAFANL